MYMYILTKAGRYYLQNYVKREQSLQLLEKEKRTEITKKMSLFTYCSKKIIL